VTGRRAATVSSTVWKLALLGAGFHAVVLGVVVGSGLLTALGAIAMFCAVVLRPGERERLGRLDP
jgi:hypothetical protein